MSFPLSIPSSIYRELDVIPEPRVREVESRIAALAEDPHPSWSQPLGDTGCEYAKVADFYYLVWCVGDKETIVVAVLLGPYHPLH